MQFYDFSCKLSGLGFSAEKWCDPKPVFCLAVVMEELNGERIIKFFAQSSCSNGPYNLIWKGKEVKIEVIGKKKVV